MCSWCQSMDIFYQNFSSLKGCEYILDKMPDAGVHNHNKIILNLMIKNESKIIERCLKRALEHVDAISILDTGSTDDTLRVAQAFLKGAEKPFKISVEPFKNFGYNRTISFQKAQDLCNDLGWDADMTYTMAVDADMLIKPSAAFKDFKLDGSKVAGYNVIQQNGNLKYYNTRFMRCSYNWKCIGATHEYWSGDPTEQIPIEIFYIDDVNDGGCKSDKYERDIRLLTEEIKENPNNGRAHFYLAQTLRDSGKFKEAIEHYKRRIEIGDAWEELWYAHYQLAKCYEGLDLPEEMEAWALKAFKMNPARAEPLYYLLKYFKDRYEHFKAYQYYLKGRDIPFPKHQVLFIEYPVYEGLFEYESTILSCYIFNKTKQDTLYELVDYVNTKQHNIDNVFDNMQYYIDTLVDAVGPYKGEYTKLFFPYFDEYRVSSCCIVPVGKKMLMNTRLVNYSIDGRGQYHMRSPDGHVKTKNGMTWLNSGYYPTEDITILGEDVGKTYESNIEGLEDVRIFPFAGELWFTASTKNLAADEGIHIALGKYDVDGGRLFDVKLLEPPRPSSCEKNWIFVPEESGGATKGKINFIYGWHPLEIGAVGEDNKLTIHTTFETPKFFSRFRGSSPICEYDGMYWCVVHFVKYSTPRVYMHSVVAFNRATMKPEMYSLPFVFRKHAIEYCLGFHIRDGIGCFVFSQNDSDPGFITMPMRNLRFLPLEVRA
jgi:tetratricopeptide (TPR) repeat protein